MDRLFKWTLIVSAVLNLLGALTFLPWFGMLRELGGFPDAENPFYGLVVALFIFAFGVGYLWTAISGSHERVFVAISAFGKLSFGVIVVSLAVSGDLPSKSISAVIPDFVIALIFITRLVQTVRKQEN